MNFSLNNSNKNEIKPIMELNRSNSYIKNSISITKKNTLEYDNIISKDISKISQEIPYKFYESDLKNSTNLDKMKIIIIFLLIIIHLMQVIIKIFIIQKNHFMMKHQ